MSEPEERKSQRWVWIAVTGFIFLSFGCFCCFFLSPLAITSTAFHGMFKVLEATADMDKAYYEECEKLTVDTECKACCSARGHYGMTLKSSQSADENTCGCVGTPQEER